MGRYWRQIQLDCWKILVRAALLLTAIIACFVIGYGVSRGSSHFSAKTQKDELPGAMNMTMCVKCGHVEERRCQNLADIVCTKCGGRLGYLMGCNECGEIFPYVPPTAEELPKNKFAFMQEDLERKKCPHCQSEDTVPLDAEMLPKKESDQEAKEGQDEHDAAERNTDGEGHDAGNVPEE